MSRVKEIEGGVPFNAMDKLSPVYGFLREMNKSLAVIADALDPEVAESRNQLSGFFDQRPHFCDMIENLNSCFVELRAKEKEEDGDPKVLEHIWKMIDNIIDNIKKDCFGVHGDSIAITFDMIEDLWDSDGKFVQGDPKNYFWWSCMGEICFGLASH